MFFQLFFYAIGFLLFSFLVIRILLLIVSNKPSPLLPHERFYLDFHDDKLKPLSSLSDEHSFELSVVIPAYNETKRLPLMLDSTLDYLEKRLISEAGNDFSYEILVVDDGSTDETTQVALDYAMDWEKKHGKIFNDKQRSFRVLSCIKNRGKGGAVTQGMTCSSGRFALMADADGATDSNDIGTLLEKAIAMDSSAPNLPLLIIGSRAHLTTTEVRSFIRNLLMKAFHLFVYFLTSPKLRVIKDTQCGFKLFSREAIRKIFPYMHVEGWIFDIEMLYLAAEKGIYMEEVSVNWHEVSGSKLNIIQASIEMAIDLLVIRANYLLGNWNIGE